MRLLCFIALVLLVASVALAANGDVEGTGTLFGAGGGALYLLDQDSPAEYTPGFSVSTSYRPVVVDREEGQLRPSRLVLFVRGNDISGPGAAGLVGVDINLANLEGFDIFLGPALLAVGNTESARIGGTVDFVMEGEVGNQTIQFNAGAGLLSRSGPDDNRFPVYVRIGFRTD